MLADVFALLERGVGLRGTLAALVDFACADPRMETGCLFYKMRNGRHRLGPNTRALVDRLDAQARGAYAAFLQACYESGEWTGAQPVEAAARYLAEQVALAITQRGSGVPPETVRGLLTLALSVFTPG